MSPSATAEPEGSGSSSPLERLLDVTVYAPIGLLANKGEVVKDLAGQGRKQVAFSRSLGRAALKAMAAGRSGRSTAAKGTTANADAEPSAAVTTEGEIADYASLSARDIIGLIPSCSPEQLRWIEQTERAGKGRVTVSRALARD